MDTTLVKALDLRAVNALHADEICRAVEEVAVSGWYLLGNHTADFEREYAAYIGTRHCVGVGNGLDALTLIYRAYIEMGVMKPGDEVIVPANTYIASILAVTENGLRPILVEPRAETLEIDDSRIEEAITPSTRSIMIVHLYGRCAYTARLGRLCRERGLKLVEDNAQAHGCMFTGEAGRRTGSLGDAAGHSFYPTKNLGALGDAGAVTTDDTQLADIVRRLANYGQERKYVFSHKGRNSRIDEMQAAVLSVKLRHLDEDNRRRQSIARYYYDHIDNPSVTLPTLLPDESNVYHLFPILSNRRDSLKEHLAQKGIETQIHYPIPPHRQQCYREWGEPHLPITDMIHQQELSLPISPAMNIDEAKAVVEAVNTFTK